MANFETFAWAVGSTAVGIVVGLAVWEKFIKQQVGAGSATI